MLQHYPISVKLKAVKLYNQGYGSTTIARKLKVGESTISKWIRKFNSNQQQGLEKQPIIKATPEFKIKLVCEVLEKSLSCERVALKYRVSQSAVESWTRKVRTNGYDSLYLSKPKGRPRKTMPRGRPKKQEPQTELEKLKVELERARTEIALLKKVQALVEQKEAQMLKIAKSGLKPSKN